MELKLIGKTEEGQDGAIWGKELFRLDHLGNCIVYDLQDGLRETARFVLDKSKLIVPHSNAVVFGCEYYEAGDEYPLLYSNIYNNYAKAENPLRGVCCVYRLQRKENSFVTTLVQLIEIGFVEDSRYWRSSDDAEDVRPYGNFVIDRDAEIYYGFTMRDACKTTRYFSFKMPKVRDGKLDEVYGVRKVTLQPSDILDYFDCEYHRFVQGACAHGGKIYSVEGFNDDPNTLAAIRVIDPAEKKQLFYKAFTDFGTALEPECIDFYGDTCMYSDAHGNLYEISF